MAALATEGPPVVQSPQPGGTPPSVQLPSPARGVPTNRRPSDLAEARRRRLVRLWHEHERAVEAEQADRPARVWAGWMLVDEDRLISRCPACREWRYRSDALPCQACLTAPVVRNPHPGPVGRVLDNDAER